MPLACKREKKTVVVVFTKGEFKKTFHKGFVVFCFALTLPFAELSEGNKSANSARIILYVSKEDFSKVESVAGLVASFRGSVCWRAARENGGTK